MLDSATTRMRQAMSLPNILFGIDDEEIEKLVEEDPATKINDKKAKKKWYARIPNPGSLLNPLRRSFTKLKRKHDHYESADESSEKSSDDHCSNIEEQKDEHEQFNYLSEKKLSISDSGIPYTINEQTPSTEEVFESDSHITDAGVNRELGMKQHFGKARALLNNHVTIADFLAGRYRKL